MHRQHQYAGLHFQFPEKQGAQFLLFPLLNYAFALQDNSNLEILKKTGKQSGSFSTPFEGFTGWLIRNRTSLLISELAGILLVALILPFLPRPVKVRVQMDLSGIDEHAKNHFLGLMRDNDLQGKESFWQSDNSRNGLRNIRLVLPAGHKRNYPDSCTLELEFSQDSQETDSATEKRLKYIFTATYRRVATERTEINRRILQEFSFDSLMRKPSPLRQNEASTEKSESVTGHRFLERLLPVFHSLRADEILLRNLHKEKKSATANLLFLATVWQAIIGSFFVLRYLLKGK